MASLRKLLPCAERGCRYLVSRPFHSSPAIQAKAPRRSPTVRRAERTSDPSNVARTRRIYDFKESLPPHVLLQSAHKSGALSLSPEKASQLLEEYQERSSTSNIGWEKKFCDELDVTPAQLVMIAKILNRCQTDAQKSLGKRLMLSASSLGDVTATLTIINSILQSRDVDVTTFDRGQPLRRLGMLAKVDEDPRAMAVLGKVLLSQRKQKEALDWFQKATQKTIDFEGAADALNNEGQLLLEYGNNTGAETAFQKAALELDDPTAYFYLSNLYSANSPARKIYLLKAASSGVIEACHNLGVLEMANLEAKKVIPKTVEDYGMGREWLQVAAAGGFGLSMLNLAMICRTVGQLEAGEMWLEKAESIEEVSKQAGMIRKQWLNEGKIVLS